MVHRVDVERYPGTLVDLAEDLGDLRYDSLAEFLRLLSGKLASDASQDEARGRVQLAVSLQDAGRQLASAASVVERAWRICEPYMPREPT